MTTFLVTYDLRKPGRNYEPLYAKLKTYSTWCHPLESTWLIVTDDNAKTIRDSLASEMDNNDKLLVIKTANVGAWKGLSEEITNWLKKHL